MTHRRLPHVANHYIYQHARQTDRNQYQETPAWFCLQKNENFLPQRAPRADRGSQEDFRKCEPLILENASSHRQEEAALLGHHRQRRSEHGIERAVFLNREQRLFRACALVSQIHQRR